MRGRFAWVRALSLTVAGALIAIGLPVAAEPAHAASYPTIDPSSKSSVVDAYRTWFLPTLDVPAGWTGNAATCNAGSISATAKQAELDAVNYFRAMMGLDPVTEDAGLSANAQQAALSFAATGNLAHEIDASWSCYTAAAADGASRSNIASGAFGARAVQLYMSDAGPSSSQNARTVGHRRWVSYPQLGVVGMGDTSWTNSLYTIHSKRNTAATDPGWSPWPSAGYFPAEFLSYDTSWSLSRTGADFTSASVSVTKNGAAVSVTPYPVANGYGSNTLVWGMPSYAAPAAGATDTYRVSITGVGGSASSYSYDVKVVGAAPTQRIANVAAPKVTGARQVGSTLTCGGDQWSPSPANRSYQWWASDPTTPTTDLLIFRAVSGATSATYTLTDADRTRRGFYCEVTARQTGYLPATMESAGDYQVIAKPLTKTVAPTVSRTNPTVGTSVSATAGSYSPAGATVSYQWCVAGACSSGGASYTPKAADAGKALSVKVTASGFALTTVSTTLSAGTVRAAATTATTTPKPASASATPKPTGVNTAPTQVPVTVVVTPRATVAPAPTTKSATTSTATTCTAKASKISMAYGRGAVGNLARVTVSGKAPARATVSYRWTRNGVAITGATKATYRLTAKDAGKRIGVIVSVKATGCKTTTKKYTSVIGKVAKGSLKLTNLKAKGTAKVGKKLSIKPKASTTGVKISYQWLRNGKAINKATKASYKLTRADRGKKITVKVTAKKAGYVTIAKKAPAVKVKR